jgi:hypothetical protein
MTTECPYCERRVLADNGRCPGCNRDLNDHAAAQRHVLKREAATRARLGHAKGSTLGELEDELRTAGLTEEELREVMLEFEGRTPKAREARNQSEMLHGLIWLAGGILVTGITYLIAWNSEKGGWYVIAWGPALAGAAQFIRAAMRTK